jgi:hypothetical protein
MRKMIQAELPGGTKGAKSAGTRLKDRLPNNNDENGYPSAVVPASELPAQGTMIGTGEAVNTDHRLHRMRGGNPAFS